MRQLGNTQEHLGLCLSRTTGNFGLYRNKLEEEVVGQSVLDCKPFVGRSRCRPERLTGSMSDGAGSIVV